MKHKIRISSHFDGIPEKIIVDERSLKQILYNLLYNAIKFTHENGKITLEAGFSAGQSMRRCGIRRSPSRKERKHKQSYIRVSIKDNGIGLNEDDLNRIFRPFEQADNSLSRKYEGTGLGLSLTRQLVELHGGKIWAESNGEGKGSTFTFILPALETGQGFAR